MSRIRMSVLQKPLEIVNIGKKVGVFELDLEFGRRNKCTKLESIKYFSVISENTHTSTYKKLFNPKT